MGHELQQTHGNSDSAFVTNDGESYITLETRARSAFLTYQKLCSTPPFIYPTIATGIVQIQEEAQQLETNGNIK